MKDGSAATNQVCGCNNTAGYFDKDDSHKGVDCQTHHCGAGKEARLQGSSFSHLLLIKLKVNIAKFYQKCAYCLSFHLFSIVLVTVYVIYILDGFIECINCPVGTWKDKGGERPCKQGSR